MDAMLDADASAEMKAVSIEYRNPGKLTNNQTAAHFLN